MSDNNKRDHTIPACVIGRFTKEKSEKGWRWQRVWARFINREKYAHLDSGDKGYAEVEADKIGWYRGIYDPKSETALYELSDHEKIPHLDKEFKDIESAINNFVSIFEKGGDLHKEQYEKQLVPYVSSLFIRPKFMGDMIERGLRSLYPAGHSVSLDEIQESAHVSRKNWYRHYLNSYIPKYSIRVLKDSKKRFILPDIGIYPMIIDERHVPAFVVPVSASIAVMFVREGEPPLERVHHDLVPVSYHDITDHPDLHMSLNTEAVKCSRDFYVASDSGLIKKYLSQPQYSDEYLHKYLFYEINNEQPQSNFNVRLEITNIPYSNIQGATIVADDNIDLYSFVDKALEVYEDSRKYKNKGKKLSKDD